MGTIPDKLLVTPTRICGSRPSNHDQYARQTIRRGTSGLLQQSLCLSLHINPWRFTV